MAEMRENPDLDAAMAEPIGRLADSVRTLANTVAQGDVSKVAEAVASRINPVSQQPPPLPPSGPPTKPPDGPNGNSDPNTPDSRPFDWEQRWGDVKAIRDGIDRVLANAVTGQTTEPKEPRREPNQEKEKRPSPFQPIKDAFFQRTQVGRIVARTIDRVKPHLDTIRNTRVGQSVFRAGRSADSAINRRQNVTRPKPSAVDIARAERRAARAGRVTQTTVAAGEGAVAGGVGRAGGAAAGRAVGMAGGRAAGAAAGAAAGSAGGPAGMVIGLAVGAVFGEVLSGLVDLAKAARDAAYQQERFARELAQFSPSQAANVTILDAQRSMRKFELGESTAGSSQALTESINRFEEATMPLEKLSTDVGNLVGAGLMNFLGDIAMQLGPLADMIREALQKWGLIDEPRPVQTFSDFLNRVADEQARKKANTAAAIDRLKRTGRF